jgi:hypothetical protein
MMNSITWSKEYANHKNGVISLLVFVLKEKAPQYCEAF